MTDSKSVEQHIRQTLDAVNDAMTLSNKLFSRGGLFNQLAKTEAARRKIVRSRLFKMAQRKLADLQRKEASQFAQAVQQTRATMPGGNRLVKIERP